MNNYVIRFEGSDYKCMNPPGWNKLLLDHGILSIEELKDRNMNMGIKNIRNNSPTRVRPVKEFKFILIGFRRLNYCGEQSKDKR